MSSSPSHPEGDSPQKDHNEIPTETSVVEERESSQNEANDRDEAGRDEAAAPGSPESQESGEASPIDPEKKQDKGKDTERAGSAPPPLPDGPPPSSEAAPQDDGWEFHWDATQGAYFFYNRFTNETTWENPRLSGGDGGSTSASAAQKPPPLPSAEPPQNERPPAGGYNPAIHGDYDPNAWYAQGDKEEEDHNPGQALVAGQEDAYAAMGSFNRFTGGWSAEVEAGERHTDEARSRRQMNAYFDVDAAANSHDGRSLKAERSGKRPSAAELRQFKQKRKAKKEEKRRAWLRD